MERPYTTEGYITESQIIIEELRISQLKSSDEPNKHSHQSPDDSSIRELFDDSVIVTELFNFHLILAVFVFGYDLGLKSEADSDRADRLTHRRKGF